MKNKSRLLLVSTIINTVVGAELVVFVIRGLNSISNQGGAIWLFFAMLLLALPALVVLGFIFASILTGWLSFSTNGKASTIVHIVFFAIIIHIRIIFIAIQSPDAILVGVIAGIVFYAAIALRSIGYFMQKKINENQNTE